MEFNALALILIASNLVAAKAEAFSIRGSSFFTEKNLNLEFSFFFKKN